MEMLENAIKFISSYPTWAKGLLLLNLACIGATLVFAPRSTTVLDGGSSTEIEKTWVLKILGVTLFPDSPSDQVQVSAFVNGTEFLYPSIGGVEWLKVGPAMAGQTFKLPKAEQYEVRFEMRKRTGPDPAVARLLSQETVTLARVPRRGSYSLHGFDPVGLTRSGTVSAEVLFSFEEAP